MIDIINDHHWMEKFGTIEDLREVLRIWGEFTVEFRGKEYFCDRYYVYDVGKKKNECEYDSVEEFLSKGTIGGVKFRDAVGEMEIISTP